MYLDVGEVYQMIGNALDFRLFFQALIADITNDPGYVCGFDCPHEKFHRFFWDLNCETKTQFLVEQLMFDANGNYPISGQIDELLREFYLAGILEWTYPLSARRHYSIKMNDWTPSVEFERAVTPGQWSECHKPLERFKRQFCTIQPERQV